MACKLPAALLLVGGVAGQSPVCMVRHCGFHMLRCGFDWTCIKSMACMARCGDDTSCDFECEQEGYGNGPLDRFLQCSADHDCLPKLGPDCYPAAKCRHDTCNATNAEAVQTLTSLEHFRGEWWTLTGVNPHYDYYPCQHEHVFQAKDGQWINNSTYGIKSAGQHLASVMNLTLLAPGVIQHYYTDAALSPNVEVWRFVSMPHADWAFVLWCGHNPVRYYSGGFLLSRQKDISAMPDDVRASMQSDVEAFGIDLSQLKVMDHSQCTMAANSAAKAKGELSISI